MSISTCKYILAHAYVGCVLTGNLRRFNFNNLFTHCVVNL